jgi:predicted dehydrogenase
LSPAFPFDENRILTGKIGKRQIYKKFRVTDEFAPEVDSFAAAIQDKQPVEADGVYGHRDMIILDAIYQAARTQQSVTIRY